MKDLKVPVLHFLALEVLYDTPVVIIISYLHNVVPSITLAEVDNGVPWGRRIKGVGFSGGMRRNPHFREDVEGTRMFIAKKGGDKEAINEESRPARTIRVRQQMKELQPAGVGLRARNE